MSGRPGPEMVENATKTVKFERLGGLGPKWSKMAPKSLRSWPNMSLQGIVFGIPRNSKMVTPKSIAQPPVATRSLRMDSHYEWVPPVLATGLAATANKCNHEWVIAILATGIVANLFWLYFGPFLAQAAQVAKMDHVSTILKHFWPRPPKQPKCLILVPRPSKLPK